MLETQTKRVDFSPKVQALLKLVKQVPTALIVDKTHAFIERGQESLFGQSILPRRVAIVAVGDHRRGAKNRVPCQMNNTNAVVEAVREIGYRAIAWPTALDVWPGYQALFDPLFVPEHKPGVV